MPFTHVSARSGGPPPSLEIAPLRLVAPQFAAELRRARRYEHALAALALRALEWSPERPGGAWPGERRAARNGNGRGGSESAPVLYLLLGYVLRNTLRETDVVGAAPESLEYLVFLPETDERGALGLVERIRGRCAESLGMTARCGFAVFPADGFTVEDLLARARHALCDGQPQTYRLKPEAFHG